MRGGAIRARGVCEAEDFTGTLGSAGIFPGTCAVYHQPGATLNTGSHGRNHVLTHHQTAIFGSEQLADHDRKDLADSKEGV